MSKKKIQIPEDGSILFTLLKTKQGWGKMWYRGSHHTCSRGGSSYRCRWPPGSVNGGSGWRRGSVDQGLCPPAACDIPWGAARRWTCARGETGDVSSVGSSLPSWLPVLTKTLYCNSFVSLISPELHPLTHLVRFMVHAKEKVAACQMEPNVLWGFLQLLCDGIIF